MKRETRVARDVSEKRSEKRERAPKRERERENTRRKERTKSNYSAGIIINSRPVAAELFVRGTRAGGGGGGGGRLRGRILPLALPRCRHSYTGRTKNSTPRRSSRRFSSTFPPFPRPCPVTVFPLSPPAFSACRLSPVFAGFRSPEEKRGFSKNAFQRAVKNAMSERGKYK